MDKIDGVLMIGCNESGEVVINIPPNKTKREQHKTNCAYRTALKWLNVWMRARGEEEVTMEQAGVNAQVDLY